MELPKLVSQFSGPDDAAKTVVLKLVEELGFDGVDAGGLDKSWRQQPGTPVYTKDFDADGVRRGLHEASNRQPVQLSVAEEDCSACHNARDKSAHTRKQHRVYHNFDHCAFPYRAPLVKIFQLHRLAETCQADGASAGVLDFFRAWPSRNIQQTQACSPTCGSTNRPPQTLGRFEPAASGRPVRLTPLRPGTITRSERSGAEVEPQHCGWSD